jgi:hypothetical protein
MLIFPMMAVGILEWFCGGMMTAVLERQLGVCHGSIDLVMAEATGLRESLR